jgi:hypothetical protein
MQRISFPGRMLAVLGVIPGCGSPVLLVDPAGFQDGIFASVTCSGLSARAATELHDPRIESRYSCLLDTLVAVMGHAPSEISLRPVNGARGETIGSRIAITNPDDEDALFHELGHFWSMNAPLVSYAVAESLRFDPFSEAGAERLSILFADALRVRTNRVTPTNDVSLLLRILGRTTTR